MATLNSKYIYTEYLYLTAPIVQAVLKEHADDTPQLSYTGEPIVKWPERVSRKTRICEQIFTTTSGSSDRHFFIYDIEKTLLHPNVVFMLLLYKCSLFLRI